MAVYDGSPCSHRCVLVAAQLATTHQARLHILSVVPLPKYALDIATDATMSASVDAYELLLTRLESDLVQRGLKFQLALKFGNLVDEAVRYAVDYDVGMIVVGCSFRSLLSRWKARAFMQRLVWLAPCPVTMVSEAGTPDR
jgi:nucleotide-binding universal stress UspA family protein